MGDLIILSIFTLGAFFWLCLEVEWLHRRIRILERLVVELLDKEP